MQDIAIAKKKKERVFPIYFLFFLVTVYEFPVTYQKKSSLRNVVIFLKIIFFLITLKSASEIIPFGFIIFKL